MQQQRALLIVDPQNDFCEGGSLEVPKASEVFPTINLLRQKFNVVFITQDWHPANHVSFFTSHEGQQPFTKISINSEDQDLWPPHCVQDTFGSQIHKDLVVQENDIYVKKGDDQMVDSYSGFGNKAKYTELNDKLNQLQVKQVYVVGLAYDYCVLQTALSAISQGFETYLVEDCTRAIDYSSVKSKVEEELSKLPEVQRNLFNIVQSHEIQ